MTRTGKTTIPDHDHDNAATDAAATTAIAAAVAAHEAKYHAPVVVPPPVVTPPPTTGKVVSFSGTATAFATLVKDTTIDVIEIAGVTYPKWSCFLDFARPSTRPLLVRPAPGANVIWDGAGSANTPLFYVGWSSLASYITFDPRGTGGTFTARNYALGKAGLLLVRRFDHFAFHALRLENVYGDKAIDSTLGQQHTHAIYLSTGTAWRSQYWASDDWVVVGPTSRMLNGLQTDGSGGGVDHVHATGWNVSNLHRWSYPWADTTDLTIDGWTGQSCDATIDNGPNTAKGVVSNCHAVNCGPLAPGKGSWVAGSLVDGGGNVAS